MRPRARGCARGRVGLVLSRAPARPITFLLRLSASPLPAALVCSAKMSVSYSGMGSNMDNTINVGNSGPSSMGFTVRLFGFCPSGGGVQSSVS